MMARHGFRKTCDSETSGLIKSVKEKKSFADLRITFYLIVIQLPTLIFYTRTNLQWNGIIYDEWWMNVISWIFYMNAYQIPISKI